MNWRIRMKKRHALFVLVATCSAISYLFGFIAHAETVRGEEGRFETGDTLEIQKIKSNVRTLKRANERDLADIGRMVYEKFQSGEVSDMDYVTLCEEIEKREEEIEKQEEEIVKIQGEI